MARYTPSPVANPFDVTAINTNFNDIATAINACLYRSNQLPNAMNTTLDMNGYAIINQANPITLTSFNWRGPWETGLSYAVGDAVFYNSTSYICVVANTAGTFITDLLANLWSKIDLGTSFKGNWTASTAYFIGDIVVSSNQFYYCIVDHVSGLTINLSNFTAYGTFGSMASQNSNAISVTGGTISGVAITTGSINNTPIGQSGASLGSFTHAYDNGTTPTTGTQLCNKTYVDGVVVANSAQLPGGLFIQQGISTILIADVVANPAFGGTASALTSTPISITFSTPFVGTNPVIDIKTIQAPNSTNPTNGMIADGCYAASITTTGFTLIPAAIAANSTVNQNWIINWRASNMGV